MVFKLSCSLDKIFLLRLVLLSGVSISKFFGVKSIYINDIHAESHNLTLSRDPIEEERLCSNVAEFRYSVQQVFIQNM